MRKNVLVLGLACLLSAACSSDGASDPNPSPQTGTGGAPGAGGGSAAGASGNAGVANGGAGNGGAANVPPGQLVCGGVHCRGGGACDAQGACPAFLADCIASTDGYGTCDGYCKDQGYLCAEKGCGNDGSAFEGGYTWTSFSAANKADCSTSIAPDHAGQSACTGLLWLSLPQDDVIRCCCHE